MKAFEYVGYPQGGMAFRFDGLSNPIGGSESIEEYIALPKNNSDRDATIDAPATVSEEQ